MLFFHKSLLIGLGWFRVRNAEKGKPQFLPDGLCQMNLPIPRLMAVGLACCLLAAYAEADDKPTKLTDQELDFFEKQVRPLLVKRCYECHSSESGEPSGNLALDSKAGWQQGGDSGPALVPGKPQESVLIDAVRYETYEMPPEGKLPDKEIAILEKWVRMGAPDPRTEKKAVAKQEIDFEEARKFWAFQPLERPEVPVVKNANWPRTEIDRFILAELEKKGLQPNEDAQPHHVLRRMQFDLTGLPPRPEAVESFTVSAGTLAELVDHLLASPRFGEQWGRHWLDLARYADTNGSDFNATFYHAWRYRKYVIDSLNEDKPFDQFVREQLAGDLMPAENPQQEAEQLIATGFLMLGPKMLSERDKEKLRMDVVDEQLDTIGKVFLGMTIGCARCHDHKFDPIPHKDYYALAGIMRSTQVLDGEIQRYVSDWVRRDLPGAEQQRKAIAKFAAAEKDLKAKVKQAEAKLRELRTGVTKFPSQRFGILVDDVDAKKVGNWKDSTYHPDFIGKGYVHDDKTDKGKKSITFTPKLPAAGEYEVRIAYAGGNGRDKQVPVTIEHAGGKKTVHVNQVPTPPVDKLFRVLGRFRFEAGKKGSVTISTEGTTDYVIADAAQFIPVAELENPELTKEENDPERAAKIQKAEATLKSLKQQLAQLEKNEPGPEPKVLAVREAKDIGDWHVCIRGEAHNHGPVVERGFLRVVPLEQPKIPDDQSGRLQLADWVANPKNPLTARVIVNRVWQKLLGEGIVRSVDNFGRLGERPTHPELLDYLAVEFIEHDWSIKWLVREIMLSRVYRISSDFNESSAAADPANRLLWRAHRRRLHAESIRDSLLAMSGKLQLKPPQAPVSHMGQLAISTSGQRSGKLDYPNYLQRSVYLPLVRSDMPPILTVFDMADPEVVVGKRGVTNVPAQALLLLNSERVKDTAATIAKRLLANEELSDAGRIEQMYLTILGRKPLSHEVQRAFAFLETSQQPTELTEGVSHEDSWTRFVQALIASTEFRFLD